MRIVLTLLALHLASYLLAQTAAEPEDIISSKDYVELTSENFSTEILEQEGVTVAYFWATWCAPCRITGPFIEELASEQQGETVYGKLHIDQYPEIKKAYQVKSIPTFLIFKDGELVDREVGVMSKRKIARLVKRAQ